MAREKLHRVSIAMLIFNTQIGIMLFTLPRVIATQLGTNGWVAILPVYLCVTINIILIHAVYRLGKGKSFFHLLEGGLPKWLQLPIYLFAGTLFALLASLIVSQYVLIFQMIVFPSTSDLMLRVIVNGVIFLFVTKGIYNMSKANILFSLILIAILSLGLLLFKEFDILRLTPYVFRERTDWLKGSVNIFGAFLGYELTLLLFPYAESSKKWLRYVHLGNTFTLFLYLLVNVLCFGFFNYRELVHLSFPVLDMFGYIQFSFVERIQNFALSACMVSIIVTGGMYYWASQQMYSAVFRTLNQKLLILLIMVGSILISFIPKTLIDIENWFLKLVIFGLITAFILPVIALIAIAILRGRSKRLAS